jgi:hypothetical protein
VPSAHAIAVENGITIEEARASLDRRKRERQDALRKLKTGELSHPLPFYLRELRNRDRGWGNPVPVHGLLSGHKRDRLFRDFFPVSDLSLSPIPPEDLDASMERVFSGNMPDYTCVLSKEWRFEEVAKDAARSIGYEFEGRKHACITEIILKALYDLERSIFIYHPNASCEALAKFWTSWDFQRHLADFAERIQRSRVAQSMSRDPRSDTRAAREIMNVQLAVYAHELTRGSIGGTVLSRKEMLRRYQSQFAETVRMLDICWAAAQHYSELKRWLRTDSPLKDGSVPDRAFRTLFDSGKKPGEYRKQSRPSGWK